MRRLDSLLDRARAFRSMRAARAQGKIDAVGEAHWLSEIAAAQGLVELFCEDAVASQIPDDERPLDRRRRARVNVLDLALAGPFVDRCTRDMIALIGEMRPAELLRDAMLRQIAAEPAGDEPQVSGADPQVSVDPAARIRPPEAAALDVAVLAVETLLLEVVRRVLEHNDLTRPVSVRARTRLVAVEDGRIVRPELPREEKAERKAARERRKARARAKAEGKPLPPEPVGAVERPDDVALRNLARPRLAASVSVASEKTT